MSQLFMRSVLFQYYEIIYLIWISSLAAMALTELVAYKG